MAEWLKECEICNAGLCKEMDRLLAESTISEHAAAKQLALEAKEMLGFPLYSGPQLRDRYRYYKGKKKKLKVYSSKDFTQEELNSITQGSGVGEIPPKKEAQAIQAAKELKTQGQISHIAKEIAEGKVSDDDAKTVGDALAKAINNGKAAPRIGSAVATAVKKSHKKGVPQLKPEPDNFQRLWKHVLAANDGLTYFADGTIKPTTPDEANAAKGILAAGQSIIVQFARLGIDVVGTYETFVNKAEEGAEPKDTDILIEPAKEQKSLRVV
jgi:hypothetical protein